MCLGVGEGKGGIVCNLKIKARKCKNNNKKTKGLWWFSLKCVIMKTWDTQIHVVQPFLNRLEMENNKKIN